MTKTKKPFAGVLKQHGANRAPQEPITALFASTKAADLEIVGLKTAVSAYTVLGLFSAKPACFDW